MNHKYYNPHLLSGLIFVLFSLSFLLIQSKKAIYNYLDTDMAKFSLAIKTSDKQARQNSLKPGIADLNKGVNRLNLKINLLLNEANEINKTIMVFMNNSPADSETLDSLQTLENSIITKEEKIDSLNILFRSRSDSLLTMMNEYNNLETDLGIVHKKIDLMQKQIQLGRLFSFLYLFFFLFGLITGIILIIKGLKTGSQID